MSTVNEETPLLSVSNDTSNSKKRINHTRFIYAFIFGTIYVLLMYVYYIRQTLPTPLSDAQATALNDFPGIHSYNEYLSHFTAPHSANQKNNGEIKDWIVQLAYEFKQTADINDIVMDIIDNDTTNLVSKRNKFNPNEYWYVESRNIMIRIVGESNDTDESFLVNAHYDSVSTSHGVTDNGMGTAVALELLRYFVNHPPRHTVIFLFNNFEEGGLIGADAFVEHPWFSSIKLFVNLEGTGAGGRALLFRGNILSAIHGLASSSAHLLHASPLGNDLLQAKLLKSDTDYTVFSKHGVPGLDIAFYYPRSHYHTQRDDLAHTTLGSLQHMGQMALGLVTSIDSSPSIVSEAGRPEPAIYYDILGRFMLVYSFNTCQIIHITSLIGIPLLALIWFAMSRRGLSLEGKKKDFKAILSSYLRGTIAALTALLFIVCFLAISYFVLWINPSVTYGNIFSVVCFMASASTFALFLSQYVLARVSPSFDMSKGDLIMNFNGLNVIWWLLLLFSTYLGSQEVAAVYFVIYFFISNAVATTIVVATTPMVNDDIKVTRVWPVAFLVQIVFPFILMAELLYLSIDSMRHTTADGTPEVYIYLLVSGPIVLMVMHLIPWINTAGSYSKAILVTGSIYVFFFILVTLSDPFNGNISPNRIVFNQEYNASDIVSTVALMTSASSLSSLKSTLEQALPLSEYSTLQCNPYLVYQTRCEYETMLTPTYARDSSKEISVLTEGACGNKLCEIAITTITQHSQLCQLKFPPTMQGLNVSVNGQEIILPSEGLNRTMEAVMVYTNEMAKPIHWFISFDNTKSNEEVEESNFTCIYDDWTEGELPAFTTLRNNMPIDQLLTIRGGVGLAKVHYQPISFNMK
ncbi:hypothetical protein BDB01DRAFT_849233 [Pilobolus umbonatus]|nr:hypothetical protein BDB01DRAFT_849233 [Pilobolus umbonatus]